MPKIPRSQSASALPRLRQGICSTKREKRRQIKSSIGAGPRYLDDEQNVSMTCFAPKVVTDANGRFTLPALVVGQEYEISVQRETSTTPPGPSGPKRRA